MLFWGEKNFKSLFKQSNQCRLYDLSEKSLKRLNKNLPVIELKMYETQLMSKEISKHGFTSSLVQTISYVLVF